MIDLNIQFALKNKIGSHGIAKGALNKFVTGKKSLVKKVFANQDKMGFAFLGLPDDKALVAKIKKFANAQKKHNWENIVVLGIGGSSLGLIALQESLLGPLHNLINKPRLFVVDNIDPTYVGSLFENINVKKTLFIVISKSGGTTEPMVLYSVAKDLVEKKVKNSAKHFVFITDPKAGLLRPIGLSKGIEMFDVPPKVGGRFSVLSAVGLLPAALVGIDIENLIKGAKKMRDSIQKDNSLKNPALQLASLQYLLDKKKGKTMTVLMPYSNYLFRIGDWYRQLLAESIGKNEKSGPTPINALGSTDQHSQLQLYAEGPKNKFILFMRTKKHAKDPKTGKTLPKEIGFLNGKKLSTVIDAAYAGTARAIADAGRPSATITVNKIDANTIGELFMLFEFKVAILGYLYKVNAFNQPGVEASKIITKKILKRLK